MRRYGFLFSLAVPVLLLAQQYRMPLSCVSSGGQPGSGTGYGLNGSLGQVAQDTGRGTGYRLYGGSWQGFNSSGATFPESGWVQLPSLLLAGKARP